MARIHCASEHLLPGRVPDANAQLPALMLSVQGESLVGRLVNVTGTVRCSWRAVQGVNSADLVKGDHELLEGAVAGEVPALVS